MMSTIAAWVLVYLSVTLLVAVGLILRGCLYLKAPRADHDRAFKYIMSGFMAGLPVFNLAWLYFVLKHRKLFLTQ